MRLFMGISDEIEDATIAIDETKDLRDWSDEATIQKLLHSDKNISQSDPKKKLNFENDKSFDPQSNLKSGN